jgi:hypothetical protein
MRKNKMAESKRYIELLEEMKDLHRRKNDGYAGIEAEDPWVNFRMSEKFGVSAFMGCLVRLSDKYIRVTNLAKDENCDRVGENIKDTLFDLSAYALIAICLYEEMEEKNGKRKV